MEKQFMKEAWTIAATPKPTTQMTSAMEEENSALSMWEENYQDLSGWCMDPFQEQCDFPIGEFDTNEYSGTKNIDNGVSINNMVESTKESKGFLVDKESRWKFMEVPYVEDNVNNQKYSKPVIKSEIDEITSNDVLLDAAEFSADLRTDDWNRLATDNGAHNALINIQKESPNTDINISTEYSSTIPFELTKIEKDSWDAINTFDNPGPNNFDLLSYLCDDEVQSADGSVSRVSGPAPMSTSSVASPDDGNQPARQLRNTRSSETGRRSYPETHTSSSSASSIAAISAALDSVTNMPERASRTKNRTRTRKDSESNETRRGEKRCLDSDSEDRMSDCSYRSSRKKNNEASRKSRLNKKAKENEMMSKAIQLERDNRILKMKVEELEKLVTSMRNTILQSALKKN